MMNYFSLCLVFILISSCTSLKDETNKKLPNIQAGLDDISHFFDMEKLNPNNFTDLNLMLFDSDDYLDYSMGKPFMYYAMDTVTLRNSVLVKQDFFSILILDCPFETSVGLFYKQNGQEVTRVIEDKYYPDNVLFYQLNDTALVCQYYWGNIRVDSKSVRTYYFFGAKTGLFKYGYTSVDAMLKLDNFVIKENGILLKEEESGASLLILPDTLIQLNLLKGEIFKPHVTPFNKLSLGERP